MQNKLKKLFSQITEIDPPAKLADFVFSRIEKEKNKRAKRQLIFSRFGLLSSTILTVYVGVIFGQTFWQSEFWAIFSLAFSDAVIVAKNWDTFLFSLLETFPVVHATILLIPVFLMFVFANFYFSNKVKYNHKFNLLTY